MKFLLPILGAVLVSLAAAQAQPVSVGLLTEQDQFIPGEELFIKVAITNTSGRTLQFDERTPWLRLNVVDVKNFPVPKLADVQVKGSFTVGNGEIAKVPVDLARFFDLSTPNHYAISATVFVKELGDGRSPSSPKGIDIVKGTRLWEQDFGYQPPDGGPIEPRKYTLQQAYNQKSLRLYARVTDGPESRIFKVFPISELLTFSRPEAQIDSHNKLHVLNQSGARTFDYLVISPSGEVLIRQLHEYTDPPYPSRPHLSPGSDGMIIVAGGRRRLTANDYPREDVTLAKPKQ